MNNLILIQLLMRILILRIILYTDLPKAQLSLLKSHLLKDLNQYFKKNNKYMKNKKSKK